MRPSSANCTGAWRCPRRRRVSSRAVNPLKYWPSLILFVIVALAMAALIARGLQAGAWRGAGIVAVFLALFLWQGGNFFRRNRPGAYRPDALPPEVMPKG